jgi:hypothetical protein
MGEGAKLSDFDGGVLYSEAGCLCFDEGKYFAGVWRRGSLN